MNPGATPNQLTDLVFSLPLIEETPSPFYGDVLNLETTHLVHEESNESIPVDLLLAQ
jgi:hypothetical protein